MNHEELKQSHGRIAVVETSAGLVVFRKPSRHEFKRVAAMGLVDKPMNVEAFEALARALVVQPSPQEFDKILDEWPGLPVQCATELLELAGVTKGEGSKSSS